MYRVFFSAVLPLVALACLLVAVVWFCRGLGLLVRRCRWLYTGLHASDVLQRAGGYVPVFSYTCCEGREVDILGETEFPTREAALQARRALVFAAERPDAHVGRNVTCYIGYPLVLLTGAVVLMAICHYLLVLMPD